jgi:hypothetical protein
MPSTPWRSSRRRKGDLPHEIDRPEKSTSQDTSALGRNFVVFGVFSVSKSQNLRIFNTAEYSDSRLQASNWGLISVFRRITDVQVLFVTQHDSSNVRIHSTASHV